MLWPVSGELLAATSHAFRFTYFPMLTQSVNSQNINALGMLGLLLGQFYLKKQQQAAKGWKKGDGPIVSTSRSGLKMFTLGHVLKYGDLEKTPLEEGK